MAINFGYLIPAARTGRLGWIDKDTKRVFDDFSQGTDVFHLHDAVSTTQSTTYVKLKTITLGILPAATLRISFRIKISTSSIICYGRVYRNGVAVGTEQTNDTTSFVPFIESIPGWGVGDTIELYLKVSNAAYVGSCDQFRIVGLMTSISNS